MFSFSLSHQSRRIPTQPRKKNLSQSIMVETRRGSSSSKRPLSSSPPPSNTKRSKVIISFLSLSLSKFNSIQFLIINSILSDYHYRFLKMLHQPLCLQFRSKNLHKETNLVNLIIIFNNHLIYQKLLLSTFLMVVIMRNLILTQSNLTLCLLSLQVF